MNEIFLVFTYLIVILYFILLTKLRFRTILLPNTIYTILWGSCGIASIYNNLGLIKPSLRIHAYIIISIFVFNIFYITFGNRKTKHEINKPIIHQKHEINYKLIKILNVIAIILISKHFIHSISILISNGFDLTSVRNQVYVGITESGNFIMMLLTRTIPSSIFNITALIASIDLCMKKKELIYWSIIGTLVYTITFGGRFLILNFIIYYISAYLIMKKQDDIKINKKHIITGIILLSVITISRGLGEESLLDKIILYFAGSFSFLEVILNSPTNFGFSNGLMYGYLTFGFILEPIVLFLKAVFGFNIDVPSYFFNIYVQDWYNIGDSIYRVYNNNTTMLYTFLRDFGEFGVIIGTLFIAILISINEKNYRFKNDLRSLLVLVYMYTVVINSTIIYSMTNLGSSLMFILIIICVKSKNKTKIIIK